MKTKRSVSRWLRRGWRYLRAQAGRSCLACDRGNAIAEFAVVLPVLLLVVMGIFTFGVAMNDYVQLTEAVNTGARLLSISRGQTTNPCAETASAVYQSAPNLTESSFTFSFMLDGNSFPGGSCSSSSTTTGAAGDLVEGTSATVTVTYPCDLEILGVNYAPGCTLQAETTELVQ